MEGVVGTKQEYDEFEMLLGEIPNVTSVNPHAEADAKLPICGVQKDGRSSASNPLANLYRSPRLAKQGADAAYIILNYSDNPFDPELQGNGKIDGDESGYKPANLDEPYLPDERSLKSALENSSIDDSTSGGTTVPSSVKYNKPLHAHSFQFDVHCHSPVKKFFSPVNSVDVSAKAPYSLDGLNTSNPTLQEYPPSSTNVTNKFSFQVNNHMDKLPKFNVHELVNKKPESFTGVPRDQWHNSGSMYSGGMSFVPGRNAFQFFSGVSFSGAEFPSSAFQQQCYVEGQHPTCMPPQHFSQPHISWQKLEEDRYHRMHQQCFYIQQHQNQEVPPFPKGNNASIGSLTGNPMKPCFELPISHQIQQVDQESYWSRSVPHRGVNQLSLALMGSGSCRYYTQRFGGKGENCTDVHAQKQATGSSVRYSSKDFKGVNALNKLGEQIFPKKILTRSQGTNSLKTLKSSIPASNQSPIHADFEGRVLTNGQLQPSLQISTSLQVDGRDSEGSSDNSGEKLTSRSPKPKYKSLNEVIGRIYMLAKDPHGCRFLQEKFAEGTPEDVHKVFVEIIDHVVDLMIDPYGNYLVQKLLEVCNEEQKMYIIRALTSKDGELIRISCDMHGTRAIQKVIETLRTPQQASMIVSSVKPGILALIKDNNGNHVAQRCLQCLSPELSKFLFDAAVVHCVELARDRRGCCVLQKCLSHCSGQLREQLISEISCNALVLSQDPFGNYVIQYLLELKVASAMEDVLNQLKDNFGYLSMQKYSSNVVEKCLKCATEDQRILIILELIKCPQLLQILQDPYGNYVIQSAIKLCKGALHAAFMKVIRPHIPALRSNPYGRKVLSSFSRKK
uniref:Pumilio 12 n=1 Tax=Anthurium amnicola TaxID=1678845 RepID=A0A1D1XXP3_9ARAE